MLTLPRSGYRGSDLVLWHDAEVFGTTAIPSAYGGTFAVAARCASVRAHDRAVPQECASAFRRMPVGT
jgi:hypothetical protein